MPIIANSKQAATHTSDRSKVTVRLIRSSTWLAAHGERWRIFASR
jgi:hypothetical protein